MFCPSTTTGTGELVVQTGEARLVVDWRVNPEGLLVQTNGTHGRKTRSPRMSTGRFGSTRCCRGLFNNSACAGGLAWVLFEHGQRP